MRCIKVSRVLPAVVTVAAMLTFAADAFAHARLKRANPPVGGTVRLVAVPEELQVWFTEGVEAALSEIKVVNAKGERVDRGDTRSDPADPTLLRVTLMSLKPGRYRVTWRVVSRDTHKTNGTFPFQVRPGRREQKGA